MTPKQKKGLKIALIVIGVVVIILLLLRQKGVIFNRSGDVLVSPATITQAGDLNLTFDPFKYVPDTINLSNTIVGDGSCACGCNTPEFVDRLTMIGNNYADQMMALQESTIQGYLALVPSNVSQYFNQSGARQEYLNSLEMFGG